MNNQQSHNHQQNNDYTNNGFEKSKNLGHTDEIIPYYYYMYQQQQHNLQIQPYISPYFPPPTPIKPSDPRNRNKGKLQIKNQIVLDKKAEATFYKKQSLQIGKKQELKKHNLEQQIESQQNSSQDEENQKILGKRNYRKDPILDSSSEIEKWLAARRRNYPSKNRTQNIVPLSQEMSILETKIRKKIMIVNSDHRAIFKKLKNMDVLKRIILSSHSKKIHKNKYKPQKYHRTYPNTIQQVKQPSEDSNPPEEMPIQKQIKEITIPKVQTNQQSIVVKVTNQIEQDDIINEVVVNQSFNRTYPIHRQLDPQQIINHLKIKQKQDRQWANSLLQYKTNSLNYRYTCGTLQTSFSLEDLFKQSTYLIQSIRYIVKNNFLQKEDADINSK